MECATLSGEMLREERLRRRACVDVNMLRVEGTRRRTAPTWIIAIFRLRFVVCVLSLVPTWVVSRGST